MLMYVDEDRGQQSNAYGEFVHQIAGVEDVSAKSYSGLQGLSP